MGNVGERASVDDCRSAFRGLDKIRLNCINQQAEDGSGDSQVIDSEWSIVEAVAQDNIADAAAHVVKVFRKAENGHDFGSRGDVEAGFLGEAVGAWTQAGDYVAQ